MQGDEPPGAPQAGHHRQAQQARAGEMELQRLGAAKHREQAR